ncbi:MAG TPA: helix-hairpin-helix domain-containing protein [Phycisphaerales bacterium]|nr:helix-hairpin-helix domain-containing protein [Phycisphaerales bacterium]
MNDQMPPTPPGTPSPTRWAAAGFLGGASIVGMLWAIMGRAPAVIPMTSADAAPALASAPDPQPVSPVTFPTDPPPTKIVIFEPGPSAVDTGPADRTPVPAAIQPAATSPAAAPAHPPTPATRTTRTTTAPAVRLNINTASAAELELLPRIGPTLAGRIIDYRTEHGPIRSLRQLTEVKGIGARTVERLEPYIRFE